MEKIDFDITSLENEQILETIESFVCLHENHLNYKIEYWANIRSGDDDSMPFDKDCYSYLDETVSKDSISGIYLSWRRKIDQWKILISTNGVADDLYIMFTDTIMAKKMYNKIKEWKYGKQ